MRTRKIGNYRIGFSFSLLMAGLLLMETPSVALETNQVFVYQHGSFGGAYMRIDNNKEIPDLRNYNTGATGSPNWNDQISSVKVGADEQIVLYEHINFGGASITLFGPNSSSSMPSGWNDKPSSLKVMPLPGPAVGSEQVAVCEHKDFGGAYMTLKISDYPDLRSYNTGQTGTPNWNDRISSIKVGSNVKLIAYQDINYKGSSTTLTGRTNNGNLSGSGWNDKISSIRVVPK